MLIRFAVVKSSRQLDKQVQVLVGTDNKLYLNHGLGEISQGEWEKRAQDWVLEYSTPKRLYKGKGVKEMEKIHQGGGTSQEVITEG